MKEKPIIICQQLIPPTLDGQKTKTRRVIKKGMDSIDIIGAKHIEKNIWRPVYQPSPADAGRITHEPQLKSWTIKCPYQVGDKLWVKETYRIRAWSLEDGKICVDYKAGGYSGWIEIYPEEEKVFDGERFVELCIQCSDDAEKAGLKCDDEGLYYWKEGESPCRWRSSRFMPKTLARIWLEVTDVRIERLQDITIKDICSEGLAESIYDFKPVQKGIEIFANLWDSLNAKRGYSWESNPYVWVYEFKRIT